MATTYRLPLAVTIHITNDIDLTLDDLRAIASKYASELDMDDEAPELLETFTSRCVAALIDDATAIPNDAQRSLRRLNMTPTIQRYVRGGIESLIRSALQGYPLDIDHIEVEQSDTIYPLG